VLGRPVRLPIAVAALVGFRRRLERAQSIPHRARKSLQALVEIEQHPIRVFIDLAEEFLPSIHVVTGAPLDAPEDEALRIDERHDLDLTEAARQYIETALPLQPLCSPTCQGLCPVCGTNLNVVTCTCATESASASGPFAALAGLMGEDHGS